MSFKSGINKLESSDISEDIGNLVSDSFSDVNSDDSGSWMQKIDVTNFKQLTDDSLNYAEPELCPISLDHGGYAVSEPIEQRQQPSSGILTSFPSPDSIQSPSIKSEIDEVGPVMADSTVDIQPVVAGKSWIKPMYSYSCLIALSLKNSKTGQLTVAEIYNFMCENFPYFRNAPAGWKNSVRHNLSLNKCFQKIEIETPGGHGRKSCLWTLNPAKIQKMDQEIRKWREKDPSGVLESLSNPDDLELIEKGLKGLPGENNPYLLPSFPELVSPVQSQLLLVRSAHLPYISRFSSQQYSDGRSVVHNAQVIPSQTSHSWPTAAKVARVSIAPPSTPPRAHSIQEYSSPQPTSTFSTPSQYCGTSLNTQLQQSSPFAHTPPYSPNVHSPQLHSDWASSTPRMESLYQYSPYGMVAKPPTSMISAYHNDFSPCKVNLNPAMGPYEAASSALNNNSLLQTALAQSPCRGPVAVTLQNL